MQNATNKHASGIPSKFRLSIFQLVLLTTGVAALLAWSLQDRTRELVWLESTLKYEAPPVPKSYRQGEAGEIFSVSHADGWRAYRYHFYRDYDLANDKFLVLKELEEINIAVDGIDSAKALSYANGYNDARKQIQELLLNETADGLRRKLARKKASSLPILLIGVGCIFAFAISMLSNKTK